MSYKITIGFLLAMCIISSGVCITIISDGKTTADHNDTTLAKTLDHIRYLEAANRRFADEFHKLKEDCDTSGPICCAVCARIRISDYRIIDYKLKKEKP